MKRGLPFLALLLALIPLAGIGYFLSRPQVTAISPGADTPPVSAYTPLRLTFNHPMDETLAAQNLSISPAVEGDLTWQGTTLVFTPRRGWPSGTTINVQLAPGTPTAGFPRLALDQAVTGSFSVREPLLSYLYPAGETANVYLVDPQSGRQWQLTAFPEGVLEFSLDPRRGWLYYSQANAHLGADIYRVRVELPPADPSGTPPASGESTTFTPVQLTDCGPQACREPHISPDGATLAYERSGEVVQVWLLAINEDGSPAASRLAGAPDHQTVFPVWAENGSLVFYDSTEVAYLLLDPQGELLARFPNETGRAGAWSPDGAFFYAVESVVLESAAPLPTGVDPVSSSRLLRFDLAGRVLADLTGSARLDDAFPTPGPHGLWLAFARRDVDMAQWVPGRQLWLMALESGDAYPLTTQPTSDHYAFRWSPDGRHIAFVRSDQAELGRLPELWLADTEFGTTRRLVLGAYDPLWAP